MSKTGAQDNLTSIEIRWIQRSSVRKWTRCNAEQTPSLMHFKRSKLRTELKPDVNLIFRDVIFPVSRLPE